MADELTVVTGWSYSKNGATRNVAATSTQFDVSANPISQGIQSIGTAAHEALGAGEVTSYGFFAAKNLNATNFIQIGYDDTGTFRPFVKLLAGESCQLFLNSAPYAQADTGACLLDYTIISR